MNCSVFRDLLPAYLEGLCSSETGKLMEEHAAQCEECRKQMQKLEWTQKEEVREPEWEMSIEPLKKVKKRIKHKNIALVFVTVLLVGLIVITGVLTYGQLFHKGVSFETVYDGLRFASIGREFAKGNIEPLYKELWDPYSDLCEQTSIIQQAYPDKDDYLAEMKRTIEDKWETYFAGRHLQYGGIYSLGYETRNGQERMLEIALKFTTDDGMEYYIGLQKEQNGKYRVWDLFGHPEINLTYTESGGPGIDQNDGQSNGHIADTLFACLPHFEKDANDVNRQWIRLKGQSALDGDDFQAKEGLQCQMIMSEAEILGETDGFSQRVTENLQAIMDEEYYPTDLTAAVVGYDREKHLYRYQMMLEFTELATKDKSLVIFECYRIADYYVMIQGSERVYDSGVTGKVRERMEGLFR